MNKKLLNILVFNFWILFGVAQSQIEVPFFNNQISIEYSDYKIPKITKQAFETSKLENILKQFESLKSDVIVSSLNIAQIKYGLNDWLLYKLGLRVIREIYQLNAIEETLILYTYLRALRFDVRLAYWGTELYVYAASDDQLYKTPFIRMDNRRYYNLTAICNPEVRRFENVILFEEVVGNHRLFSFDLSDLPLLDPTIVHSTLAFEHNRDTVKIDFEYDKNIQSILAEHPLIEESAYFNIPFSSTLSNSLLPALKNYVNGKSFTDAIKLFIQITRSCFLYAEDEVYFGHPKPMAAEELFFYERSDCEDRSALLYQLVKSLLDLPIAVIIYPEHVTVGIALPDFKGEHILWNQTPYYICDPTGPPNSTVIGKFPQGYKDRPYEILLTND